MANLIRIYSHPRSGTHLLEAFLAKNFYPGVNLKLDKFMWGHWSNRKLNEAGSPYAKLFHHHYMLDEKVYKSVEPGIYIYRDGRAVAASVWNTPNFLSKRVKSGTFSEFLRQPLDWYGSPSIKSKASLTIAQHWNKHVSEWAKMKPPHIMLLRYEDLVNHPESCAQKIAVTFNLKLPKSIDPISKPVGLLPNKGKIEAWRDLFSEQDESYFLSQVGKYNPALYKPESKIWRVRTRFSRLDFINH